MKGVQCYDLFGGIALKNHAFFLLLNYFITGRFSGILSQIIFITRLSLQSVKAMTYYRAVFWQCESYYRHKSTLKNNNYMKFMKE